MPILIAITAEPTSTTEQVYDYDDRVTENPDTGDYEVVYTGQKQGRRDRVLTDAVNHEKEFRVYYRSRKTDPFTYIGHTHEVTVDQARAVPIGVNAENDQLLRLRMRIPSADVSNTVLPAATDADSYAKYKKAILDANAIDWETDRSARQFFNMGFYDTY